MHGNLWAAVLAGLFLVVPAVPAEGAGRKLDPAAEASVDEVLATGATSRVRLQAAIVLGHAGTERSIPFLARALEDRHAGVRAAAALALGNLNSAEAVAPLVDHAEDLDPFVRDHVQRALLSLRGPAVLRRLAVEASDAGPGARAILAQALAGFEGEVADAALVAMFDEREPRVREAHRAAVAALPAARRDAMVKAGLKAACPHVRTGAIRGAGPIAGAAAIDPLLSICLDDTAPTAQRVEARRALVAIRELIDPEYLDARIHEQKDPAKRARTVALAAIRAGPEAEGLVFAALSDPAPTVRWTAARAVAGLDRARAAKEVQAALQREQDERVRRALQRSAQLLERDEPFVEYGAVAIDELPEP